MTNPQNGVEEKSKSPPNGYTIINPSMPAPIILELVDQADFKVREFTHIFAWAKEDQALTVKSDTWNTLDDFLKEARKRKFSLGITGKRSGMIAPKGIL